MCSSKSAQTNLEVFVLVNQYIIQIIIYVPASKSIE